MENEILWEIIKWAALAGLLYLLFRLLNSIAKKAAGEQARAATQQPQKGRGELSEQPQSEEPEGEEDDLYRRLERKIREAEGQRKIAELEEIARKDPELLKELAKAGNLSLPSDKPIDDPETLKRIAERISDELLEMMRAALEDVIQVDLESGTKLEESSTGGDYMDMDRLRSQDQLPNLRPEELAYPDPLRTERIVSGQAKRNRFFNLVQEVKLLYVLEDESGSMGETFSKGSAKWMWSRGIVIRLTRQAMRGRSKFIYRSFDASPKSAIRVTNAQEASQFFRHAISVAPSGGGTNILGALEQAIEDINNDHSLTEATILLISDGEDSDVDNPGYIQQLLGPKIKLHVILIGAHNQALQQVATSYQVIA